MMWMRLSFHVLRVIASGLLPPHKSFITHMATLGYILFTPGSTVLFSPEFTSEITSKFLSAQDRAGT